MLFVARKNQLSLKSKNSIKQYSTILILFEMTKIIIIKIDKVSTKSLMAGNKFMPELDLKQPEFTSSTCGSFTKHHERI